MDSSYKYNHIRMYEDDMDKTFFMMEHANYVYNVLPFGLKNVDETYQKMMNKIFEKISKRY